MAIVFAIQGWSQATLNETFDGTTFPPEDWTTVTTQGAVSWERSTSNSPRGVASASVNYASSGHQNWLITPKLNVTTGLDTISFWIKTSTYYANTSLSVFASSTTNDISSFDTINPALLSLVDNQITTTWTKYSIPVTNYIGQNIYIAFRVKDQNGMRIMLDDITGPNLFVPSCPRTSIPTIANITSSSCDISWTELGTATAWTLEYKPASDVWTNATTLNLTSTTTTLNNLPLNTAYDFRVKSVCIPGVDESLWKIGSFRTACDVITNFPWIETFESTWNTAAVAPGNKVAPFCWYIIDSVNTATYFWKTTSTANTGTGAIYMQGYGSATTTSATYNNNEWLITPIINFTGNERLTFWSKKSSTSYKPDLLIYAMDVSQGDIGGTTVPNFVLVGQIDTNVLSTTYSEYYYDLNSLVGQHRLAFVRKKIAHGSVYLDDVKVAAIPSCFKPTQLANSTKTINSADLTWTNGKPTDNAWWVYYKNVDSTSWDSAYATTNPYTLGSLNPATKYEIYIRTDCGASVSEATTSIFVTTLCIPLDGLNDLPWNEGFETLTADNTLPACWSATNFGSKTKTQITDYSSYNRRARTGTSSAYFVYGCNDKFITPQFDLYTGQNYSFSFWYITDGLAGWQNLQLRARSLTDTSINMILGSPVVNPSDTTYQVYVGDFSPTQNGLYEFIIECQSTTAPYYITIDDIKLEVSTCAMPQNVSLSNVTATSVDMNWDLATNGQWLVEHKLSSDTIWTSYVASVNSYSFTNLTPNSNYDFRIASLCGSDTSMFITLSKSTPCLPIDGLTNLPWNEGFETLTVDNTLPICWSATSFNNKTKTQITNSTSYNRVAKTGTSSAYFVYGCNDKFTTPQFSLYAGQKYAFSFWYITDGLSGWQNLQLRAKSLTDTSVNQIIGTPITNVSNTTYQSYIGTFTPVNSGVYEFSIECASNSTPYYLTIDDIRLEIANCDMPQNLVSSNITPTSLDLNWDLGNGSQWLVQHKTSTDTVWTGVVSVSNSYSYTNLTSQTKYNFRVATLCGADTSIFASKTINTPCFPFSTLPYTENFDTYGTSSGAFPPCWSKPVDNGGFPSLVTTNNSAPASMQFESLMSQPTYAVSPRISANINALRVRFMLRAESLTSSGTITVGVMSSSSDTTTFEAIQTIQPTNTIFNPYEVSFALATLSGANNFVAFRHNSNSNNYWYWLDDVIIDSIPACAKPTTLAVNTTTTTANISWINGNSTDAAWYIYYKTASATTWDSISVTGSSPYTLQNLIPATQYNYYMRTDCSTQLSEATNIYNFYTKCNTISTLPWSDYFDSYGTGSTVFPLCWTRTSVASGKPYITSTNFSSPGSMYFTSSTAGSYIYSATPEFDASIAINTLQASFKLRKTNATSNIAVGVMVDPTNPLTFDTIAVLSPTATSTWENFDVNFSTYTGLGKYIAFRVEYNTATSTVYVDNLDVYLIPTCTRPNDPVVSNPTQTSLDVVWTDPNVNNNLYKVYYRLLGDTTWSVINNATSPTTINGLSHSSTYQVAVATDCSTEVSMKTSIVSALTSCGAMTIPTAVESFVTVLPNVCWSRFSGQLPLTGNAALTTTTSGWVANNKVTQHNVKVNLYSTQNYWLVTPSIDLGSGSSSNKAEFDIFLTDFGNADTADLSLGYADKKFVVLVSTDNGLTWTANNKIKQWDNAGSVDTLNKLTNVPLHVAIPLQDVSGTPYSGIVKIAFYGESTVGSVGDNDLHIDNFQVTGQVCAAPTSLTTTGITQTTAIVSWTPGASETSWEVKLGATGVATMVTSPTYTFTSLTTATQYTAYVRANCGTSNSAWVPVTFTTSSAPIIAVVTTAPVTTVTYNTASFVGSYTPGGDTINAVGFEYKTTSATSWTTQTVSPVASPFSYNATSLIPSTQYKVRAFVTKQGGVNVYGDTVTFTTAVFNAPTVTTDPVTNITSTTATFNGTTAQGTESIVARGFEYKTNAQTWTSALDVTATGSTTITANVTGLVTGTNYDVRAYAETASGKTYGSEISFIAGSPVVLGEVSTLSTTNIDTTSATLNGSVVNVGGATIGIEVGFVYSTITNPVIDGANVIKVPVTYTTGMTNYNSNITGLTPLTPYYVKSYITNAAGTAYGQEMTFTTLSGLNDIDVNSMSVQLYPNPATTEATLVIKGITGKAKIMISDVQGRTINTLETVGVNGEASQKLNLSNFAKGIYYIRIQNAKIVNTQKLIVE
ncbi:MAG: type sorting protein [Bacteroidetes bacterium]|nr:type sorting protein [Bacteroidota bacterium]